LKPQVQTYLKFSLFITLILKNLDHQYKFNPASMLIESFSS